MMIEDGPGGCASDVEESQSEGVELVDDDAQTAVVGAFAEAFAAAGV